GRLLRALDPGPDALAVLLVAQSGDLSGVDPLLAVGHDVARVQVGDVGAAAAADPVAAAAVEGVAGVVAAEPGEHVLAATADQVVLAVAAEDGVGAVVADQGVVGEVGPMDVLDVRSVVVPVAGTTVVGDVVEAGVQDRGHHGPQVEQVDARATAHD